MEDNSIRARAGEPLNHDPGFPQSLVGYALLSWLLATSSALLVIPRAYSGGPGFDELNTRKVQLMLIGLCSLFSFVIGFGTSLLLALARQQGRFLPPLLAPFFGVGWGIILGALGGFPLFFIGGIFLGWMLAVPIGVLGLTLFAVIYEALAARRHLRWYQAGLIAVAVSSIVLGILYWWLNSDSSAA